MVKETWKLTTQNGNTPVMDNEKYYDEPVFSSAACPALSASVSITPTTIVSGGSITYTSTAIGGVPTDDGFGHEILIDGVPVYNTGLRKAAIMSGTLQITGISPGTHAVTSRITDGCLPAHQVATSPPTTLTVTSPVTPILISMYTRPSQNPSAPASEGYIEVVCTGSGAGTLTYYRDGNRLGSKPITISGSWTDIDDFGGPDIGFGTWDYSVSDGIKTLHSTITNQPTCPALSASLSITPTTIVSGGSITYTSTAIGGQYGTIGDDAFGHEILIDGVSVYNTGLGKATTMSGTLQITGISPGSHSVTSRITDGCLPVHQVATSPSKILTVTVTCPALSATLSM